MPNLVTVLGGTGFLGHRIVKHLVREGVTVRVAVRHPERVSPALALRGTSRILPMAADIHDSSAVAAAVAGADAVVNAVSAYVEAGEVTYAAVHLEGARTVAEACARHGTGRLVHISGIGADPASSSAYIAARGRGELAVRRAFPPATILRPSVMFACDDVFLNALAGIATASPLIPLIGRGQTRLQPVHADDVAAATCRSLRDPASAALTYELGGPDSYTLRQILELILTRTGHRRVFIGIPFAVAAPLARLLERLPSAPLTLAQVDLLRSDNVPARDAPGLRHLGIQPHKLTDTIARLTVPDRRPPKT
jgi:NADH dehydrogenase